MFSLATWMIQRPSSTVQALHTHSRSEDRAKPAALPRHLQASSGRAAPQLVGSPQPHGPLISQGSHQESGRQTPILPNTRLPRLSQHRQENDFLSSQIIPSSLGRRKVLGAARASQTLHQKLTDECCLQMQRCKERGRRS